MSINSHPLGLSVKSIQLPVTELDLKIGDKLLIVVAHRKTWEVISHGILFFRHDSTVQWDDEQGTELFVDPFPRIRDLMFKDCEAYITLPGVPVRTWYLYEPMRARFEQDRMVITVDRTDFSLGGSK